MHDAYATWVCYLRTTITDGTVIGWTPEEWMKDQFNSYAVTASRNGVLIGEIYLHQIPNGILIDADDVYQFLRRGLVDQAVSFATHYRTRIGNSWHIKPRKDLVTS